MLVLCWKSTLTAILAQDHFQTLATVVPKLKTWLGTQLGPRRQNLTHALSGQSNRGKFLSLGNSWRREKKLDWEWCERTRSRRSERWTTRKNRRAVVSPLLAMNPFLRTSRISRWGQDHSELPLRFLLCFLQLATSKTIAKNLFSWSKVVQFVGNQLQDFPETSKPFIVNNTPWWTPTPPTRILARLALAKRKPICVLGKLRGKSGSTSGRREWKTDPIFVSIRVCVCLSVHTCIGLFCITKEIKLVAVDCGVFLFAFPFSYWMRTTERSGQWGDFSTLQLWSKQCYKLYV